VIPLTAQWRLMVGVLVGLTAGLGAHLLRAPPDSQALIGWNAGAASYAGLMWLLFARAPEADVRLRAGRRDATRGVMLILVLMAILASLAAILAALIGVSHGPAGARRLVLSLAALTLVTSWIVLQTVFVAHYAHRHFQAVETVGPSAGFLFPGDPPRGYMDFVYLAICIGATAQISDPSVPSTGLRNLVTAHAVTSFFYNTAILALGINILSGLIGH